MHAKRVMGLHADRAFGYLYSISEDGHFKLTDFKTKQVAADFQPGSGCGLKYMLHCETRGVFIIGDGDGMMFIFNQNAVSRNQRLKIII